MDNLTTLFILFMIYSFAGWVMETTFATIREGKFINRGFLRGCFCPIYGIGAVIVIKAAVMLNLFVKSGINYEIINIFLAIILVTLLEYFTGLILENLFNCKLWDYSDNYGNIKGYVCIKYSLLWGILIFTILKLVNPVILDIVLKMNTNAKVYISVIAFAYFVLDTVKCSSDAIDLRNILQNHSKLSVNEFRQKIIEYKRFFMAYPRLRDISSKIIKTDIRSILDDKIYRIKVAFKDRFQGL